MQRRAKVAGRLDQRLAPPAEADNRGIDHARLDRSRSARLLQRMSTRKGIDLVHFMDNALHSRIRREIALEIGRPYRLSGKANVGNRDLVALAITPGLFRTREMGL